MFQTMQGLSQILASAVLINPNLAILILCVTCRHFISPLGSSQHQMDPLYSFGLDSAFVVPHSFLLQQVDVNGLSDI